MAASSSKFRNYYLYIVLRNSDSDNSKCVLDFICKPCPHIKQFFFTSSFLPDGSENANLEKPGPVYDIFPRPKSK